MTPELEAIMSARHKAFIEWNAYSAKGVSRAGLREAFLKANRAYVLARASQPRQITRAA
jgi:hypothetical protein